MFYSLLSDLHIDFNHPPITQLEKMIIVAGDTANGLAGLKFLKNLKQKGHQIFAVPGNHEHYANATQKRTIVETEQAFYIGLSQRQVESLTESVVLIGANGWYHIDDEFKWKNYMNDARNTASSAETINRHAQLDAQFIYSELNKLLPGERAIIVTRTAPCLETLDERYKGSSYNDYYWNPYMRPILSQMASKILLWHHGHTHGACDKIVDNVRIITNPRGYPGENPYWKPITIEI